MRSAHGSCVVKDFFNVCDGACEFLYPLFERFTSLPLGIELSFQLGDLTGSAEEGFCTGFIAFLKLTEGFIRYHFHFPFYRLSKGQLSEGVVGQLIEALGGDVLRLICGV